MSFVLFGPPGAGKGTQSVMLAKHLGALHISTGDLFRAAIKNQTPLGQQAKAFLDRGELVPDGITIGMLKEHFQTTKTKSFILDGFPRNVAQAEALKTLLLEVGLKMDQAVFLEVDQAQLIERLTGRRVCKNCGEVYHVRTRPSQKEGVCDKCGGSVVQRNDDRSEVIENRLVTYEKSTAPLRDYYRESGCYFEVNGMGEMSEIFQRILKILSKK